MQACINTYTLNFFSTTRKLDDKGKHVRCVIPTKDNPPPEMSSWLLQFQVFIDFENFSNSDNN